MLIDGGSFVLKLVNRMALYLVILCLLMNWMKKVVGSTSDGTL